jgi:hypothetical protein
MLILIRGDPEDPEVWFNLGLVNTTERALSYFCFKIKKGFERASLHHV